MQRPFNWSFTRLKGFESCPKKHYECDIAKNYKEEGDFLVHGNFVHKSFENALKIGAPLPRELEKYNKWVNNIRRINGRIEVEKQFAIDRNFKPCPYFDKDVWYRGKCDVLALGEGANRHKAIAFDWKTGKVQTDSVQLMLMAQCVFAHYPDIQEVTTIYVWLQDNTHSFEVYTRQEVANAWIGLLLRVKLMEDAYLKQDYPPKPSGLCRRHCPVVSCPFHGKGARG